MRQYAYYPVALRACLVSILVLVAAAASAQSHPDRGAKLLSVIPFSFERNAGQVGENSVDWLAHSEGMRFCSARGV